MATYYKYVERNAEDRIDWNEVGKSVSDMLKQEAKVRLDKKAEIDERSRQIGIELSNAPTGDYDHGNNFINEYVTNMTEYRRMQDNLLKSGQLNLGDYTRNRQNNTDGTKLTFELAKAYQEAYTEKMERWQTDDSAYLELWEMTQVEGMANLRTVGNFINPTNGVVSLAKRDANGNIDINNATTVAEMYTRIGRKYDRYDADGNVREKVDYLGDYVIEELNQAMRAGNLSSIKQIDDKTAAPGFAKWKEDTIESMMTNEYHVADMLTTGKLQTANGDFFDFTYDETKYKNDKTGSLIFLDRTQDANGVPVLTAEQEQIVRDFLGNQIDEQIDYKISIQSAGAKQYAPQPTNLGKGLSKQQKENALTNMAKLVYGNEQDVKEAIDALEALNPGLDIVRDKDKLIMTQGGVRRTPRLSDFQSIESFLISQGNFILGEGRQIDDINKLVTAGGIIPQGAGINYNLTNRVIGSGAPKDKYEPMLETLERLMRSNIDKSAFVDKDGEMLDESTVKDNLNTVVKNINGLKNYTVTQSSPGVNEVTLTSSIEGEANIVLRLDQDPQSLIDALIGAGLGNIPDAKIPLLIEGKRKKITTPTPRTPRSKKGNTGGAASEFN
jgi:hypothetical protein